ncbi:predicted protein [Naegleria gruberi]|uniref:Predicted protein n=1 Tax=Naegleria gruberi TaxID=5762 RepID=D2VQ66_NAEGR|nr:uncharacterized protein NAEGRDRAFT_51345 [Naegleria gruberi]EFC40992.1 predicted protein [Naegleria gruberi]|eukprot:XP_002673736.1 predicted protein [Naegleria gruberi strain NEG-M]
MLKQLNPAKSRVFGMMKTCNKSSVFFNNLIKSSTGSTTIVNIRNLTTAVEVPFGDHLAVFKPLTQEYVDQAILLTCHTFSEAEPINRALKATPLDMFPTAKHFVTNAAKEGLGHVAIDNQTGMVVAVVYSEDFVKAHSDNFTHSEKYAILNSLFEQLHSQYFNSEHSQFDEDYFSKKEHYGEILHVIIAGTYNFYRSKGLIRELVKTHLEHCKAKGFKHAMAECSGEYSRRAFEKLGFESKAKVFYNDFKVKDRVTGLFQRPFQDKIPQPHVSMDMVWKHNL